MHLHQKRATRRTAPPSISVYVIADDTTPTDTFQPGLCVCKACKSPRLSFSAYLEDAKCDECFQWQNEDLLPA